ncbi:MAG: hypothetical protein V3U29_08285 [Phycisphaeraceae bacterium]
MTDRPDTSHTALSWRPWRHGGIEYRVNPVVAQQLELGHDRAALVPFLERLLTAESTPIQTLKDDPNRSVVRHVAVDGRHYVIKRYRVPRWKTWLLYRLRQSPTWREWYGALRLVRAHRRVSAPLAIVHQPARGREAQVLILPYIEGRALERMIQDGAANHPWRESYRHKRLDLARIVGTQIGRLLTAGIVNRDHKLSNLIMDRACQEHGDEPVIIDPLGLRRRRSDRQVYRMLVMLLRTSERAGPVTTRECMTCLKAVLKTDPSLARHEPRRLRAVARHILAMRERGG